MHSRPCCGTIAFEFSIKQRGGERVRAAYYTKLGSARDVLRLGEIDTLSPGPGEIHVRVHV